MVKNVVISILCFIVFLFCIYEWWIAPLQRTDQELVRAIVTLTQGKQPQKGADLSIGR